MNQLKNRKQFLTFNIDQAIYGIDINLVTEIVGIQQYTPISELPHYIRGIINLRGKIIPLIDVRLRLGEPEITYNDRTCIIVITIDEDELGLIVDCVHEVINVVNEDEILAKDEEPGQFISQIIKLEEKVYMIVDINELVVVE